MEVRFLRQPLKYIKKADKNLKKRIFDELQVIKADPTIGKPLQGNFKGVLTHKFVFNKTNYRIAYRFKDGILIIYIATRENFYKDLEL